ncbi:helix-turn-helix transcriptional regulator [Aliikangiella maris]|uniref:Uncharacterized protein n=2 Tax=Aliikangiella maris TaxID=3162458 RepID=A0ABV3MIK0_9GAMM
MEETFLTKQQIAERYQLSVKSVNTMCSVKGERSLPPFIKIGPHANSPIRFRLTEVLAWEEEQAQLQRQRDAEIEQQTNLEDLLGL